MSHKEMYFLFQLFYCFVGLVVLGLSYKLYKKNFSEETYGSEDQEENEMMKYQKGIFYVLLSLLVWVIVSDLVTGGGLLCD